MTFRFPDLSGGRGRKIVDAAYVFRGRHVYEGVFERNSPGEGLELDVRGSPLSKPWEEDARIEGSRLSDYLEVNPLRWRFRAILRLQSVQSVVVVELLSSACSRVIRGKDSLAAFHHELLMFPLPNGLAA